MSYLATLTRPSRLAALVEASVRRVFSATPAAPPAPVVEPAPAVEAVEYAADEMPDGDAIEAAAREYARAADLARRADRGKRAAKKILGRLPVGTYGSWRISRKESARQTVDLAAVTAMYKTLNLGPVPMKPCAPSLVVELIEGAE